MDQISKFKQDLRAKCKRHKIKLKFIHKPKIDLLKNGVIRVSGYFDSTEMVLVVATKKSANEWLEILIHESCHLDQYVQSDKSWNECFIDSVDCSAILDLWLNHKIELTKKQLDNVIIKIIDVERDCDIRAIKKIKKYKLQHIINIDKYTQKANEYHLQYDAIRKLRKWDHKYKSPYTKQDFLNTFSTTISNKYTLTKSQLQMLLKL